MPHSIVQALVAGAVFALMACSATATEDAPMSKQQQLTPTSTGYADAAEGLRVYYEIYGKGEPIVVLAGGFGDISSMAQMIGPLSRERQVIGIDLEGHGRTALRATPMSHEQKRRRRRRGAAAPEDREGRCRRLLARRRRGDPDGDPASRDGAQPDRHLHRRRARRLVSRGPERHGSGELSAGQTDATDAALQALRRSRAASGAVPCSCSTAWAS